MTRRAIVSWAACAFVAVVLTGCKTRVDSFFVAEKFEWSETSVPKDEAKRTELHETAKTLEKVLDRCEQVRSGDEPTDEGATEKPAPVVAVDPSRSVENVFVRALEPIGIITVPGALLYEGLGYLAFEDYDSLFEGSNYETYVHYDEAGDPTWGDNPDIEIYVEHLLVDNFTEGRWRDSLGGNGEELTLQVSVNGLTASGSLQRDDAQFLIEKAVQLHDPALALLSGNAQGAKWVAKYNKVAQEGLALVTAQAELAKAVRAWLAELKDGDLQGVLDTVVQDLSERLRGVLVKALEKAITGAKLDEELEVAVREGGAYVIDEIVAWFEKTVRSIDERAKWKSAVERIDVELKKILDASDALSEWAARYSIDEKGLIETIQAVQGLASADRLTALSFTGIRPKLLEDIATRNLPFGGTAARLLMRGPWNESASWYVDAKGRFVESASPAAVPGLVYRGKLSDVSATGDAEGLTVSTLLLELDNDEVVKVLRYAQAFVSEGASIGGGTSEVAVSAIIDAAAIVAEKIAQNDVELKAIDLRFLPKSVAEGLKGSPGATVFELKPCRIVVARNFYGTEFGAVAVIRIQPGAHPDS